MRFSIGNVSYEGTGMAVIAMGVYGLIALASQSVTWVWQIAAGIIIFMFILELLMSIRLEIGDKKR